MRVHLVLTMLGLAALGLAFLALSGRFSRASGETLAARPEAVAPALPGNRAGPTGLTPSTGARGAVAPDGRPAPAAGRESVPRREEVALDGERLITATFESESGEPLQGGLVTLRLKAVAFSSSGRTRTVKGREPIVAVMSSQGRCTFAVPRGWWAEAGVPHTPAATTWHLLAQHSPSDAAGSAMPLTARTETAPAFVDGSLELGTLRYSGPGLVASGVITNELGIPVRQASIELYREPIRAASTGTDAGAGGPAPAKGVLRRYARSNAEGRFDLRVELDQLDPADRHYLVVRSMGHVESEPVPIELSQRDVEIELHSTPRFLGRLEVDPDAIGSQESFEVLIDLRRVNADWSREALERREVWVPGPFAFDGYPSGLYDLVVWQGDPFPAVTVEGIRLLGEGVTDARLEPLFVASRTYQLTVLDAEGLEIRDLSVERRRDAADAWRGGVPTRGGRGSPLQLRTGVESFDVRLSSPDHRALVLTGVDGDRRATLELLPLARLSVDSSTLSALEPDDALVITLTASAGSGPKRSARLTRARPMTEVRLPESDSMRLSVELLRKRTGVTPTGRTVQVGSPLRKALPAGAFSPERVEIGAAARSGRIDVQVDPEALSNVSGMLARELAELSAMDWSDLFEWGDWKDFDFEGELDIRIEEIEDLQDG